MLTFQTVSVLHCFVTLRSCHSKRNVIFVASKRKCENSLCHRKNVCRYFTVSTIIIMVSRCLQYPPPLFAQQIPHSPEQALPVKLIVFNYAYLKSRCPPLQGTLARASTVVNFESCLFFLFSGNEVDSMR